MAKLLCIYMMDYVFHYKTHAKRNLCFQSKRRANVAFARDTKYNKMQNCVTAPVTKLFNYNSTFWNSNYKVLLLAPLHNFAVGGFLVTQRGRPGRLRACRIWTFINSV